MAYPNDSPRGWGPSGDLGLGYLRTVSTPAADPRTTLDVVREVAEAELAAQQDRGRSLDQTAGLVLGFAGVIAGFAAQLHHEVWRGLCAGLAGLAAVAAVWSLSSRPFPVIDAELFAAGLADRPVEQAERALLGLRIGLARDIRGGVTSKSRRVQGSAVLLLVAVLAGIVGATLG